MGNNGDGLHHVSKEPAWRAGVQCSAPPADYDRDGFRFVRHQHLGGRAERLSNGLFHNNGDGTFTNADKAELFRMADHRLLPSVTTMTATPTCSFQRVGGQ